jgi:hypothetical protein
MGILQSLPSIRGLEIRCSSFEITCKKTPQKTQAVSDQKKSKHALPLA